MAGNTICTLCVCLNECLDECVWICVAWGGVSGGVGVCGEVGTQA